MLIAQSAPKYPLVSVFLIEPYPLVSVFLIKPYLTYICSDAKLKGNKGSLFPLQHNVSLLISPIIPCCPVSADLLRFTQMPRSILLACDTISGVVFASVYFTNLFRTG